MGQSRLSDSASVDWLCEKISAWGEKLRASGDLQQRPERSSIQGESFSAQLSLIPDYEKQDGSLAIDVRLKRAGPGRHRSRTLLVSWGRTLRRLDYARPWRIVAGNMTKSKRRHRRLLDSIQLGREIYWTEEVPDSDLRAQVILALAQLRCLEAIPSAREWLAAYIKNTFRFPVPQGSPRSERQQAKESIAFVSADTILSRWSFPEDCRAFRKYVAATVRTAAREYFRGSNMSEQYRSFDEGDSEDVPSICEPSWDPREDGERASQSSLSVLAPKRSELKDEMSVEESAQYLNRSKGYVYRLIRQGRIAKSTTDGSLKLLGEDIARVGKILAARHARQRMCKELEASGKTSLAARKAILRNLGSAPKI